MIKSFNLKSRPDKVGIVANPFKIGGFMKNLVIILFTLYLLLPNNSIAQSYPHISELSGLEDSSGSTHLFFRYIYPYTGCWSKSIYHFDVSSTADTLFISDSGYEIFPGWGCQGDYVNDYEFFNNDPSKFIYCGYNMWIDPVALLRRYDGDVQLEAFGLTQIEISEMNDSLVYVSAGPRFFKSTDGGYNFVRYDSMQFIDEAIISLGKFNDSQIYGIDNNNLVRSEDDGSSYIIVDNSQWSDKSKLFYDVDQTHIYGLSIRYNFSSQSYTSNINVSNDNGNPFTWTNVISQNNQIKFTNDESNSGEIYYSLQKNIFKSTDYGSTFQFYKQLSENITGLFKKSGTNILYASTPLKIYEITSDTIQVIKSLPIPEDAFNWFPLNLGDRWIYLNTFYGDLGDSSRSISIKEVVGYKTVENQVYNELQVTEFPIDTFGLSVTYSQYFRVDSTSGLIYQAWIENDSLLLEELYMDLLAEVGDTIPVGNGIYLASEEPFTIFGLNSRLRTFYSTQTPYEDIELAQDFGLKFKLVWELVENRNVLKGCIINGVVYGDTLTVGVEDEVNPIATEFKLEQNYPNPFNPSTVISYQLPVTGNVTLKVYDVLGNEIATLVNEEKPTGEYEIEFNATGLPSGIYFYKLVAGEYTQTRKMILLK
jgi:hypothetical protein